VSASTGPGVLEIIGELTVQTAGERKAAVMSLLEASDGLDIVLDGVTELDTAGLQLLLLAQREAAQLGRPLRLLGVNPVVTDILAIAQLSAVLGVHASGPAPIAPEEATR
jgi:anti-sigma B factor antagonist